MSHPALLCKAVDRAHPLTPVDVALGVSALLLYPPAALVVLGAGLVCCGLGLFGVMPVILLIQAMFRGLASLFRKAFSRRKTA